MRVPNPLTARPRSAGFTLIELLVSIAIAVFLLGGILTIVQDTRRSATSQSKSTQMQDNARLALIMLTDVIQAAGYFPDPGNENTASAFGAYGAFASAALVPTITGLPTVQAVAGTGAYTAAAPGDTIAVRYVTANGDGILNCTGTSNTSGGPETFVNSFSLDNQGNLQCTLTTLTFNGTAYTTVSTSNPITLATNVKNLQIQYGVRTSGTSNCNCADGYLDATQMSATNWANVVAVQVTLTFANPVAGLGDLAFSRVVSIMNKNGVEIQL